MKKLCVGLFLGFVCVLLPGEKYILNEVLAVITGTTKTTIVVTGDIRPSLDGKPRTLRDVVLEELMLFDGEKLQLTASDDDAEKYLKQLQKTYTKKQIEDSLQAMGFTMADVKEQIKRQDIINRLLDYKIRSDKRLVIGQSDVDEYWALHAPVEEATVSLLEARIKTTETQEQLQKRIDENKLTEVLSWSSPFTLNESDIAANKRFVFDKKRGDIVFITPIPDGFELTKLEAKTPSKVMPLCTGDKEVDDKRIKDIEEKLRIKRFNEIRSEYEKLLLSKARIKFTYESDRRAVYGE
jgi:hypothetical protein